MTSLKYNTFSEETINQCIICLNDSVVCNNDEVTLMNNMHFLQKPCDCVCYAHHKCIETWIKSNSICPICRKNISFPQTNLSKDNKDHVVVNIPPVNIPPVNIPPLVNISQSDPLLANEANDTNEIGSDSHKNCRETLKLYMIGLLLVSIFVFFSNVYIL
jgi:hypothetical protein